MELTLDKMRELLETLRKRRTEIEAVLVKNRENVQESIAQLRETQDLMRRSSDTIHELESELLEAEHPF